MADTFRPDGNYLKAVSLAKVGSFEELRKEGFVPFSLGPVYVYAGVQVALPNAFASEKASGRPSDVFSTTMHFDRPILARCKEWNYMLDIMDVTSFQWFKKWMIGMQFVDKVAKRFNVTRHFIAPILDPILLDTKQIAFPSTLDVFTTSGRRALIKPVTGVKPEETPMMIDLTQEPPEEDVQTLAYKVLSIVRDS